MKYVIFDCDGTLIETGSPKYKLFPGIKELVVELAKDHLLYVWTARGRSSTISILQDLGIYGYFDDLSTSDDTLPKPHIAGLFDLVGNSDKKALYVIGDSSVDMIGAKNFGATAIGATWNKGASSKVLKEAGADFIVSHPSECSKLIEQNRGESHV